MRKTTTQRMCFRKPPYVIGMALAILLILIGIVGMFLPFPPGLLSLALGLLLLLQYHDIPWIARLRNRVVRKLKSLRRR